MFPFWTLQLNTMHADGNLWHFLPPKGSPVCQLPGAMSHHVLDTTAEPLSFLCQSQAVAQQLMIIICQEQFSAADTEQKLLTNMEQRHLSTSGKW